MSGAITQSGPVATGHAAIFAKNGVVEDGGAAGNGSLSELGITNNGSLAFAINSGAVSGPYVQYGLSVGSDGTIAVSVGAFNGAPDATLEYIINGTTYGFPGPGGGDVLGPASSVNGHLAAFNGTSGTLLQDSGISESDVVTAINGGTISAAMLPVVGAATTIAALEALGVSAAMVPVLAEPTTTDALEALGVSAAMVPVVGASTTDAALEDLGVSAAMVPVVKASTTVDAAVLLAGGYVGNAWPIEWFGGGPGVSDNTAAWNAAITQLGTINGAILFGPGTYSFASAISVSLASASQQSLSVFGYGQGVTRLLWPAAPGGITVTYLSPDNSFQLRGLSLITGVAAGGFGLTLTTTVTMAAEYITMLRDLDIRGEDSMGSGGGTDYWSKGIEVANVPYISYDNVNILGAVASGIGVHFAGTNSVDKSSVVHTFSKCNFNWLSIGVEYGTEAQGVFVDQCNFVGGTTGISVLPGNGQVQLTVTASEFNTSQDQIFIDASADIADVIISGNLIFVAPNSVGISISNGQRFSITGNDFFSTGTLTNGIDVAGNDANNNGIISGNNFQGFANAILLDTGSSGWNVQSNAYKFNTNNVVNSGTGNTVGGGSE